MPTINREKCNDPNGLRIHHLGVMKLSDFQKELLAVFSCAACEASRFISEELGGQYLDYTLEAALEKISRECRSWKDTYKAEKRIFTGLFAGVSMTCLIRRNQRVYDLISHENSKDAYFNFLEVLDIFGAPLEFLLALGIKKLFH